jgi:hypothetical protein
LRFLINVQNGEKEMPTRRLRRPTRTDDQEYCARLSRLEALGIAVGCADNRPHQPDRLTFEQTPEELARIYELPFGEAAVVIPATMTVLKSGPLITKVAIMTPWDEEPLDLWDPQESPYHSDLMGGLSQFPPTALNSWLERVVPLRPRKLQGVIIAHGYICVPPECHDETLVPVQLLLDDERRDELSFEFGVRVDRSVMRKCERRQRERREFVPSTRGLGLIEPKRGQLRDQKSHSPQEAMKRLRGSDWYDARNSGDQITDVRKLVFRNMAAKCPKPP